MKMKLELLTLLLPLYVLFICISLYTSTSTCSILPKSETPSSFVHVHFKEIPGQYIVTLKPEKVVASKLSGSSNPYTNLIQLVMSDYHNNLIQMYHTDELYGFAGSLNNDTLKSLINDEHVLSVEPDQWITIDPLPSPFSFQKNDVDEAQQESGDSIFNYFINKFFPNLEDQLVEKEPIREKTNFTSTTVLNQAPWGCARLSSKTRLLSGERSTSPYIYPTSAGDGATIYIIDTGIKPNKDEFGDRLIQGPNFSQDIDSEDGHGHGTHVAGTCGGYKYGVAKKSKLVNVKVLGSDGQGALSGVIKGMEWVLKDSKGKTKSEPYIVNMSLGGGQSNAINLAAQVLMKASITVVAAAGNSRAESCNFSPASAEGVISVAASCGNDDFAVFSNFGKCTTVIAPGCNIPSLNINSHRHPKLLSGTSMACPHVSGLVAVTAVENNTTDPKLLYNQIIHLGIRNAINNMPMDTPNILASLVSINSQSKEKVEVEALEFY